MRRRPGHPDTIVAPVDLDPPAVKVDAHATTRQPAPRGSYSRGTGRRPGGQRHTHTAFPDPHPQMVLANDTGKLHIGPLRIERMALDLGAARRKVHRFGVTHEKRAM